MLRTADRKQNATAAIKRDIVSTDLSTKKKKLYIFLVMLCVNCEGIVQKLILSWNGSYFNQAIFALQINSLEGFIYIFYWRVHQNQRIFLLKCLQEPIPSRQQCRTQGQRRKLSKSTQEKAWALHSTSELWVKMNALIEDLH